MLILDTNIWVSYALNRNGPLGQNVAQLLPKHRIAFSNETFAELTEVLMREKFDRYVSQQSRITFLKALARNGDWFTPTESVTDCRDPKDNMFLALSKACQADFIITGDDDLLTLDPYGKTRILTMSAFMAEAF